MMDVKGYKRKGVLVFDSHIPIIWLLVVGGGYCLFPGVIDIPEKCNFTNLMCNESRLLKEDKIIILNIGNELRNRVAGGTFKYLNLQHDPITDMNKLYWDEEIARKATMIVSSCPSTSESFIDSHTTIESGDNAIDQIIIENSIDPTTYQPDYEIPNCEVSSITYEEKLTQCAPQKIKERVIRFLSEYGLSVEGRQYDIRDFWIVNRYGEPKLTFRRHESSHLGCSFMIRASKTHYHAYLTCIHCSFNASLPTIGHPGENCPTQYPNLDAKYENLCSDSKSEYDNIEDDQSKIECKKETSSKTDSEGLLTETTEFDGSLQGISKADEKKKDDNMTSSISDESKGGKSGGPASIFPDQSQSIVTSSCKTTIVERNNTLMKFSPAPSSQVIITTSQTLQPSTIFSTPPIPNEAGDTTGTTSKVKVLDKTESISTTFKKIPEGIPSKGIDITTELTDTSAFLGKDLSVTPEATTIIYKSTASISTFGIADLKTVTSTMVEKETTSEKQSENVTSIKSTSDKSTVPSPTSDSSLTGSSKLSLITSTPHTTIDNYSSTSSVSIISTQTPFTITKPSTSWTTSKFSSLTGSIAQPTLTISSSSSAAVSKHSVTSCKTIHVPSNKTYKAQSYTHVSSASSISAITQPSLNTVISSSTLVPTFPPTSITSLSTIASKSELTTMIATSEKSMPIEIETSTQQTKTTKKFDSITKKFMTRKRPTITSTEMYSTSAAILMETEAITLLSDESFSSKQTELNPGLSTEMKTYAASSPTIHTEDRKTSTIIPMSSISIESTRYQETTEIGARITSPTTSIISSDISKDYSTTMNTQTTTCRTTTIKINTSSTCKTTIPGSKSISVSSTPSSSFSAQLPNQIISTSTTTYKTTIPTAKSSFISTKESTPISSLSVTTDIIPHSTARAIQPTSIMTTEPTAMTTLPSTKFSYFSPGFNITSSISTQATKDLASSTTHFTSTVISVKMTDMAQTPLSSQLDSTSSSELHTSSAYITPKIISTTYKSTLSDKLQMSTETVSPEITPTTISPMINTEVFTDSNQKTIENIQNLAPLSISTEQIPAIQNTTTCRTTVSLSELISTTCKTTIHTRASSTVPVSIISPVTSSENESEDIFRTTFIPQSIQSKSSLDKIIFHSSSTAEPISTTCRTTISDIQTKPSTTTCRTTIPPTESIATKTTCKITQLGSDAILLSTTTCRTTTVPSPTTTCRTTATSSLTTTCRTTIPKSKLITETQSTYSEDLVDQMSTETTVPTVITDNVVSSISRISTISNSNIDITTLITTTQRSDTVKSITEQWSQLTNIPTTTTCRTTLMKSTIPTVSSSTCKTTIHHRQPISTMIGSSAVASTLSKVTDIKSESTATITQSFDNLGPKSFSPTSTSSITSQTEIPISSPSVIPTSTTCKITTLFGSTMSTLPSTTTYKTTLPIIKSSIPLTTTCKTTTIIDISTITTTCKGASSAIAAPVSAGTSFQPVISTSYTTPPTVNIYPTTSCRITCPASTSITSLPMIKSITTCPPTISSTSKIISTDIILPPTTIIPAITTCRTTGTSGLCIPTTNTPQITTTCRTTLISSYPSTSTCKTTLIDRSSISTIKMPETTLPISKDDMINTAIPQSSTLCKSDCIIGSTIASTNIGSDMLLEGIIDLSTSSESSSLTKMNESYASSVSTLLVTKLQTTTPTITTCRTTTVIPPTTTCKTTIPSTQITTSTCKTTSIAKITFLSSIANTDLFTTTCHTPTHTILSSTQKAEELSEILPANTALSSLQPLETTTCKTTYSSSGSIETSSYKTTIHERKLPISSSEPITQLITQQPIITSHISSVSSLASPLSTADLQSTPISYSTLSSVKSDTIIPITSMQTVLESKKADTSTLIMTSPTVKPDISTSFIASTSSSPISPSPSDYETNVSLIPQEDSTILEQVTTRITPSSPSHTISQLIIPTSTCKTTILGSDTTSTCKTTITSHSLMKEGEAKTSVPSTTSIFSSETSSSMLSSNLIAKVLTTTTCRTTELSTLQSTTTCRTTIPISSSLPSTTTCRTTPPISFPATITTCRTTVPTSMPVSITTCRPTISTLLPTVIQTTTCRTTIPSTLPTTSTCKTTIPTEFPTEEPIMTLLPLSNQTMSSFASPISAATSQLSPLSSSTISISSSTSAAISKEPQNYTCKTTVISRSEYSQPTSLEITSPSGRIGTEKDYAKISTSSSNISDNFTTIESSSSKIDQISTSTSLSLTEGLTSRLSTFISSLLPADWRSSQNQPTSTYSTNAEQNDITSIFLSSLAPDRDISTLRSSSLQSTSTQRYGLITDMAGQIFSTNLTTTTANTLVTDIHGYIISSNILPTELSSTIEQAFTAPSTSRTTFRSHRGSTVIPTHLFPETTTLSALSTIHSTPPCRSTAINGTGATCIITTTSDLSSYISNNTESSKDIFDNRNATGPLSKSKPCLCINWYLICLIFTIAFIFAWCLLCWQKMLL